jgi:moderate conductance mechanosensitive channel
VSNGSNSDSASKKRTPFGIRTPLIGLVRSRCRAAFATLLVIAAFFAAAAPAQSQFFPSVPFSAPTTAPSGSASSAAVVLDGQALFSVSSAAAATVTARVRAADIADVLAQIVATTGSGPSAHPAYDPATLRVRNDRHGADNVLAVVDDHHSDPLPIVTVTNADAQAQLSTTDVLAAQWQETLQGALVHSLLIRQPGAQERNLIRAAVAAAALLLLTAGGFLLFILLGRRIDALTAEVDQHQREITAAAAEPPPAEAPEVEQHHRHVTALSLRSLKPARRLTLYRTLRSVLIWVVLLAWCGAGEWCATLFPETTIGKAIFQNAFAIALIWIGTGLLDRLIALAIGRLQLLYDLRRYVNSNERARQTLRVPTIVRATNGFKTVILIFLALLATLAQVGIPVGSVVTIGGLIAIGVSLAAQNLLRDIFGGFLVLAEDQFVVGDFVAINGSSGLVERLTLRMVQIRDGSGSLVTISHSAATSVINHSRNWSRVDYAVSIEPGADVERAIAIVRMTIEALENDPAWKETIVDPVEWIGVDGLSSAGIVIRARIKTAPLRQFALQRELNLRTSRTFAEAKIGLGAAVS